MRRSITVACCLLFASVLARATVFATLRGIVHDPQHRPIAGAQITLNASGSEFFSEPSMRRHHIGRRIQNRRRSRSASIRWKVSRPPASPRPQVQTLTVAPRNQAHFCIFHSRWPQPSKSVVVRSPPKSSLSAADSVTAHHAHHSPADRGDSRRHSRPTGMQMITDYVPGAYMTHDMLHMRGGHQTSWLIDGVSIPNTKIASNVGPQIDPKDIDSLETQRGSYAADIGDRTYGVFNTSFRVMDLNVTAKPNFWFTPAISTPAKPSSHSATTPRAPHGTQASPVRAPTTASPRRFPKSSTTPPTPEAASSP